MTRNGRHRAALLATLVCSLQVSAEFRLNQGTNISADVNPADGRLAVDLLGNIWTGAARGGDLQKQTSLAATAQRPRWSPDGKEILYQAHGANGTALWRVNPDDGRNSRLTPAGLQEQAGDWHPDGERIVYSAARDGDNLDIWERDLASGVEYRLTHHDGDESEPAWSADGRHLCYVLHENDRWYLVVRRYSGEPQRLLESATPLSAPSWRPDNTLITYLQQGESGRLSLNMLILSEPPLARTLVDGEDFFLSAPSWIDRTQFVYTADGVIKSRHFEDRNSEEIPFSALVQNAGQRRGPAGPVAPLPDEKPVRGEFVIRAARLYDGHGVDYRYNVDVLVRDGFVVAVEDQTPRTELTVFDIGDITVMPGLIDMYASLPGDDVAAMGPLLLAFGVTTLVSADAPEFDTNVWAGEILPGPRLLRAAEITQEPPAGPDRDIRLLTAVEQRTANPRMNSALQQWRKRGVPLLAGSWSSGLAMNAELMLGTASMPVSPQGRRYADIIELTNGGPLLLVSGMADAGTPGLAALRALPPATQLRTATATARSSGATPLIGNSISAVVVGSRPSGLPPGLATQAELLALQAAGLPPYQVLHAATGGGATALGLGADLGRIAAGARADLLLVAGDPLSNVADSAQVIAVVRDGRFLSVASLLERVTLSRVD
ncbi:LpqB family beta-propeller domain-containing protein [Woeseia oceani]|uniref:Amidohydrolase-related domain-containing protein n=1 Tax=Woeseia oceani TaxID=1548547 RepID=A0A193LD25_9GAMM|nr:LpqB family beta-propeller domain-containing protein [Woeseia oceani]ANO50378.1 hypothetical protein BA177_03335 [Woeseia oceani]